MKSVLLLLANGFEAYEASVYTDVLGWNQVYGDKSTQLITCGLHSELKCTWNFNVKPEAHLSEVNIENFDALAIPGGFEKAGFYKDAFDKSFCDTIRSFNEEKKIISSICVGALPIGKSGVLKGRKATTYNLLQGIRQKQLTEFGATVVDQSIVTDNNITTSRSPATALDVSFLLLETLTNKMNCESVKILMGC